MISHKHDRATVPVFIVDSKKLSLMRYFIKYGHLYSKDVMITIQKYIKIYSRGIYASEYTMNTLEFAQHPLFKTVILICIVYVFYIHFMIYLG